MAGDLAQLRPKSLSRLADALGTPRWLVSSAAPVSLVLALAVGAHAACQSPPPPPGLPPARVLRVIDGSAIQVRFGRRVETVRYLGVLTPALTRHHPVARRAWESNRQLVEGRTVRIEVDVPQRDRKGHLLAYVYVDDVMVNAELVCRGYAEARTMPPNARYQELFRNLEREAREAGRGMWPRVTLRDGMVSAVFNGTPALEAVRALERATGIPIGVPASLEGQTLTLRIQEGPVEEVLRRVLGALNVGGMMLVYGPRGSVTRVIFVRAARDASKGTRVRVSPFPRGRALPGRQGR